MEFRYLKKGLLAGLLTVQAYSYAQTTYPYSTTGQAVFVQSPYNSSLYTSYPYNPSPTSASRLPAYTTNQAVFVQQPYGQVQQTITSYPARSQYGLPYTESHYASPTAYPSTTVPAYPYATVGGYTASPYTTTTQYPAPSYPYQTRSYTSTEVYPYTTTRQMGQYPNTTVIQQGGTQFPTTTYSAYPTTTVTQYPYTTTSSIYPETTVLPNQPPQPGPVYRTNRQTIMREAYDTVPGQVNVPPPVEPPSVRPPVRRAASGLERLFETHGQLIFEAIAATFNNSPQNVMETIQTQLINNANNIGTFFGNLYGQDAGTKLTNLLQQHTQFGMEYFNAIKTNNETLSNQALTQWLSQGQMIANFLNALNPALSNQSLIAMWNTHINLEAQITLAYAGRNVNKANQLQQRSIAHLRAMASVLAPAPR